MLKIGDFEIHLINDVTTHVDGGGAFGLVPRKLWSRYFKPDDDNNIPMAQHCLLVKAYGKHIVIDTGLGTRIEDKQRRMWQIQHEGGLLRALDHLGISVTDVDMVINTHLHSDHCSGNMRYADDTKQAVEPTFPNAEYIVHRGEYEDAMHPNERTAATYLPINYEPLVKSGQMRLLDGDQALFNGILARVTPGHTPFHMSVRFESNGQFAEFVCDMACYAVHFERIGWMTAYDVEPLRTLETKRITQQWALEHDATIIFPHDPFKRLGKLRQHENGSLTLEAIHEPYVGETPPEDPAP